MDLFAMMLLVVTGSTLLSALLVYLVRRHEATRKLQGTHDIEGIYISALSTLYGIFIAFMIFVVWTRYTDAREVTDMEATSLANIYRIAEALPDPLENRLQNVCVEYARTMIKDEWPAMLNERDSRQGWAVANRMWLLIANITSNKAVDDITRDHLLSEVTNLTALRRHRLLHAVSGLPNVLDAVLILGAILVICFAAAFSSEHLVSHILKTAALTIMISAMLFTVWEIDRPFQGTIHVDPDAFQRTLQAITESR